MDLDLKQQWLHHQHPPKELGVGVGSDYKEDHHPLSSSSSAGFTPQAVPWLWSCFSAAQWQELEMQALIYRYMLSGAAVPSELLHPIKKSLAHQPPSFHHHHHQLQLHHPQSQPFRLQAGYWGTAPMDPEPARCRRTDGKKWRCSRDVVPGQKYCERHVHRGRNRSRKPVEISPTPESVTVVATDGSRFALSGASANSPTHLFQKNRR